MTLAEEKLDIPLILPTARRSTLPVNTRTPMLVSACPCQTLHRYLTLYYHSYKLHIHSEFRSLLDIVPDADALRVG
jgi:hypothetical protein